MRKKCGICNHISCKVPLLKSNSRNWSALLIFPSLWVYANFKIFDQTGVLLANKNHSNGIDHCSEGTHGQAMWSPLIQSMQFESLLRILLSVAASTQSGALKQVCPMFQYFLTEEPDSMKRLFVLKKIRHSEAACCDEQKSIPHWPKLIRVFHLF